MLDLVELFELFVLEELFELVELFYLNIMISAELPMFWLAQLRSQIG